MNLLTRLKKSNIKLTDTVAIKKFLFGRYVEVLGTDAAPGTTGNNTHGFNVGRRFTLTSTLNYYPHQANLDASSINDVGSGMTSGIYLSNLKLINDKVTATDFNAEMQLIEEQEKELKESKIKIKTILKYMQENELTEFDESVYQVYQVLKRIKSSGSDIDKATEISKLLKKD